MASRLDIYNQALTAALSRGTLTSLNAQRPEADICNLWYPLVRDNVLKSASWPSTKRYSRLAVLSTRDTGADWVETDPSPGYRFAYGSPQDMLIPRYLHSYQPFEWEFHAPSNTTAIMTNVENAILHYTSSQTDESTWDTGLTMAVVYALAAHITLPLNGKPALAQSLSQQAEGFVIQAQTDDANAMDEQPQSMSELISVRGFSGPVMETQFFYPHETFNGVTA